MADPTRFGVRLKHLREQKKMTITQLSENSGVPRASIYGVEVGTRDGLSTESSTRIARALGITIDRLVGDAYDEDHEGPK